MQSPVNNETALSACLEKEGRDEAMGDCVATGCIVQSLQRAFFSSSALHISMRRTTPESALARLPNTSSS